MRSLLATLVGLLVGMSIVAPAFGEPTYTPGGGLTPRPDRPDSQVDVNVASSESGVTIFIGITTTVPGTTGSPGSPDLISNPSGPECTATPMNIGHVSAGWVRAGLAANPDTVPWTVRCDDGYFGIAWVPTDAPSAPDIIVGTPPRNSEAAVSGSGRPLGAAWPSRRWGTPSMNTAGSLTGSSW